MSRILTECTYVFSQPWVHAGIQRVVRNIAGQQVETSAFGKIVLVAFRNDEVFQVNTLLPSRRIHVSAAAKLFAWLERVRAAVRRKSKPSYSRELGGAQKLILKVFTPLACVMASILGSFGVNPFRSRAQPLCVHEGDTLLLLDASWHDPMFFEQLADLKQRGVRIIAVVYDLIPIRHSDFCTDALTSVFDGWLDRMSALADAFVCISHWVCTEVQDEIRNRVGETKMREKAYGWFHLGSELDRKTEGDFVSDQIRNSFAGPNPKFLVVGTIEPRKNQTTILDAFDRHWAVGGEATLCVVGRKGWMCDAIVARLRKHPEIGKKLFWFDDANDNDLEFAYQNADALIFASFVEGFGLPLVEGLQRGLPAIASDIPVFREVAGDFAEYFDPNSSSDLCAIIDDFSVTRRLPNARPVADWKWITWKESAQQLFDAVEKCCRELDDRKLPENAHQH